MNWIILTSIVIGLAICFVRAKKNSNNELKHRLEGTEEKFSRKELKNYSKILEKTNVSSECKEHFRKAYENSKKK